jgi:hypothetical protein
VGLQSGRQRPGDGRWQLSLQPARLLRQLDV